MCQCVRGCVCMWGCTCVWEERAAGRVTVGKKQQRFSDSQTKGPFSWIHQPSHTSLAVFGRILTLPRVPSQDPVRACSRNLHSPLLRRSPLGQSGRCSVATSVLCVRMLEVSSKRCLCAILRDREGGGKEERRKRRMDRERLRKR